MPANAVEAESGKQWNREQLTQSGPKSDQIQDTYTNAPCSYYVHVSNCWLQSVREDAEGRIDEGQRGLALRRRARQVL